MTTKFASLVTDMDPHASQKEVAARLPGVVAESPLHYWKPGDQIPSKGRRVLLGVATYSGTELYLLDVLVESLPADVFARERLDVFNVLDCANATDFERYIPGVGDVVNTPIMGVWLDGVLREIVRYGLVYERLAEMYDFKFDVNNSPSRIALRKRGLVK